MAALTDGERLWTRLQSMAELGRGDGGGITRPAFSPAHTAACVRFEEWAAAAGAEIEVDKIGNRFATFFPIGCDQTLAPYLIGSHLDTVPDGGAYDGTLGVLAALEAAEGLASGAVRLGRPVTVVAFNDEEGFHANGTLGSRAMCFGLDDGELYRRRDAGSPTLEESLVSAGYDPQELDSCRRPSTAWHAFLELHPEQGPVLERANVDIGVVDRIVAGSRYRVTLHGEAAHAGTTPMHLRDDALVRASRVILAVSELPALIDPVAVATVGRIGCHPNAANVIPGRVELVVNVRSPEFYIACELRDRITAVVNSEGGKIETLAEKRDARMAPSVIEAIRTAADACGASWLEMPSGGGHDARSLSTHGVPSGMIFVPSRAGISHHPDEYTSQRHCALGAEVLAHAVLQLETQS